VVAVHRRPSHRSQLGSIAGQTVKVNRDDSVCDLGLPIGLWQESRAGVQCCPAEAKKLLPHRAGEDGIPVTDD
jgi:hypothetical protein